MAKIVLPDASIRVVIGVTGGGFVMDWFEAPIAPKPVCEMLINLPLS